MSRTCEISARFSDSSQLDVVFWFVIKRQRDRFSGSRNDAATVADVRSDDLLRFVLQKKDHNYETSYLRTPRRKICTLSDSDKSAFPLKFFKNFFMKKYLNDARRARA